MGSVKRVEDLPEDMKKAIYIVSDVKGYDVELVNFFQLLRVGKKEAKKFNCTGILRKNLIGEDGKPVDMSLGALLQVEARNVGTQLGFHMANVGPSDERGYVQWAWAKSILGIKRIEKPDDEFLTLDGNFRLRAVKGIN